MKVPLLDLKRQYEFLREDLQSMFMRIFDSGQFILGPDVTALEQELASFIGVQHTIGVSSGTDALIVALRALGIGPGDQVLTTPFTFFATMSAILSVGAEPVFADIDPETFNLSPREVEKALTRDTAGKIKALVPVHLYGQSAEMDAWSAQCRSKGVAVIEDAAQAIGTEYKGRGVGSIGDIGCFSFFPTKNLGALGEAGLVTTNSAELAEKTKWIRTHGSQRRYYNEMLGGNFRIDTLQAGALRLFLPHLDKWITKRQEIAARYDQGLASVDSRVKTPVRHPDSTHSFHQYTLRVMDGKRDTFQAYLEEAGVSTSVYYPIPCHLQKAVTSMGFRAGALPVAEAAAKEVISIPIFPEMTDPEVEYVVDTITRWAKGI